MNVEAAANTQQSSKEAEYILDEGAGASLKSGCVDGSTFMWHTLALRGASVALALRAPDWVG
jgi:hypothetical protein